MKESGKAYGVAESNKGKRDFFFKKRLRDNLSDL
jgi:hypothetical protein